MEFHQGWLVDPSEEAMRTIPVGEVGTDPDVTQRLGHGIDGLFRTRAAIQFPSWPPGSTTDGCVAQLCWRPDHDVLEVFGLTYLDFGPEIFPSRARFTRDHGGRTSVTAFVGSVENHGSPLSFVSRDSLFVAVRDEEEETVSSVELIVGRRQVEVDWTRAVAWHQRASA